MFSPLSEVLLRGSGCIMMNRRLMCAWCVCFSQGSACVYSKKVELLHSLVFHALDMVTSRKRSAALRAASSGAAGPDGGEDAELAAQEEQFLELDDVLQEADNIDLVDDDGQPGDEPADDDAVASLLARGSAFLRGPRSRLGALRLEQALGTDAFRITSSVVHTDGALLLDGPVQRVRACYCYCYCYGSSLFAPEAYVPKCHAIVCQSDGVAVADFVVGCSTRRSP